MNCDGIMMIFYIAKLKYSALDLRSCYMAKMAWKNESKRCMRSQMFYFVSKPIFELASVIILSPWYFFSLYDGKGSSCRYKLAKRLQLLTLCPFQFLNSNIMHTHVCTCNNTRMHVYCRCFLYTVEGWWLKN